MTQHKRKAANRTLNTFQISSTARLLCFQYFYIYKNAYGYLHPCFFSICVLTNMLNLKVLGQ